jgi:hypothetical protein
MSSGWSKLRWLSPIPHKKTRAKKTGISTGRFESIRPNPSGLGFPQTVLKTLWSCRIQTRPEIDS